MADNIIYLHRYPRNDITIDSWGRTAHTNELLIQADVHTLPVLAVHSAYTPDLYKESKKNILLERLELFIEKQKSAITAAKNEDSLILLTVGLSPCMEMTSGIEIRNAGMTRANFDQCAAVFSFEKYKAGILNFLEQLFLITVLSFHEEGHIESETDKVRSAVDESDGIFKESRYEFYRKIKKCADYEELRAVYSEFSEDDFYRTYFSSEADQIRQVLCDLSRLCDKTGEVRALTVTLSPDSSIFNAALYGNACTHDLVTAENIVSGTISDSWQEYTNGNVRDIRSSGEETTALLDQTAQKIFETLKTITGFTFSIIDNTPYVINVEVPAVYSFSVRIKALYALYQRKIITPAEIIEDITDGEMLELLHPVLNRQAAKSAPVSGGICGSIGAAHGKVYFSAERLIKAYEEANARGDALDFILAMPATFAHEVKAIKLASGVISAEGGYASHAPVVSRSMNKVCAVNNRILFSENSFSVDGMTVREGDEISLNCIAGKEPEIFPEKIPLVKPDFSLNGIELLLEILNACRSTVRIYANAEQKPEAEVSHHLAAEGVGLCRTEHMFFHPLRLQPFTELILIDDKAKQQAILDTIEEFQKEDFIEIFRIFPNMPVTIRLLDAPLHEFLPKNRNEMDELIRYLQAKYPEMTAESIRLRCDVLHEFNPMLGHRGLRIAVSRPEIYQMQVRAVIKAAAALAAEGIICIPKIMIPMVMNAPELKFILFGKTIEGENIQGLVQTADAILREYEMQERIICRFGCMLETPAACIHADQLARYCSFFSFGTNDLTQTACGLSRDDSTIFLSNYEKYNLIDGNPFMVLQEPVRELMSIAIRKARAVRPDIEFSICGEQSAEPKNIPFIIKEKIDIISCSPYSIPIAKLETAREQLGIGSRR